MQAACCIHRPIPKPTCPQPRPHKHHNTAPRPACPTHPPDTQCGGTSVTTTEPAPILEQWPITMGPSTLTPAPSSTPLPGTGGVRGAEQGARGAVGMAAQGPHAPGKGAEWRAGRQEQETGKVPSPAAEGAHTPRAALARSPTVGWRTPLPVPLPPSVTWCSMDTLSPTIAVSPALARKGKVQAKGLALADAAGAARTQSKQGRRRGAREESSSPLSRTRLISSLLTNDHPGSVVQQDATPDARRRVDVHCGMRSSAVGGAEQAGPVGGCSHNLALCAGPRGGSERAQWASLQPCSPPTRKDLAHAALQRQRQAAPPLVPHPVRHALALYRLEALHTRRAVSEQRAAGGLRFKLWARLAQSMPKAPLSPSALAAAGACRRACLFSVGPPLPCSPPLPSPPRPPLHLGSRACAAHSP